MITDFAHGNDILVIVILLSALPRGLSCHRNIGGFFVMERARSSPEITDILIWRRSSCDVTLLQAYIPLTRVAPACFWPFSRLDLRIFCIPTQTVYSDE